MANIELRDIDEKIERLQELRRFMSDPERAALLNQLLASKNGNSSPPTVTTQQEGKAKSGMSFIGKIEETCKSFGSTAFTIRDVIQSYESRGYTFKARKKAVAVYTAIRRLQERGVVKLEHQGIGSQPSSYSYIHRFPREKEGNG